MDVWRAETWVGVKKHARVRARGCNAPDKYSGDESAQDGRFARTPGRTKRALDLSTARIPHLHATDATCKTIV